MAKSVQQERRRHENQCLSTLVDLGVTYRRTLGERVAWSFFRSSNIEPAIAQRVMQSASERRPTDWERFVHAPEPTPCHAELHVGA
ncbi:MAG: hypothetical protein ACLGI6_07485 [Gammaproteobacteria bacterium]